MITKLLYNYCFQISAIDTAMQFSKKNWSSQANIFRFSNNTTFSENRIIFKFESETETKLQSDIIIYENEQAVFFYFDFINEFSTLWKDERFIDVFKNYWMKISLINNWQVKIFDKFKVYSLKTEKRKIINKTFDKFHQQKNEMNYRIYVFFYFVFVTWKTSNDVRKERTVVDIKNFNKLIVFDFYFLSLQSDFINDLKSARIFQF